MTESLTERQRVKLAQKLSLEDVAKPDGLVKAGNNDRRDDEEELSSTAPLPAKKRSTARSRNQRSGPKPGIVTQGKRKRANTNDSPGSRGNSKRSKPGMTRSGAIQQETSPPRAIVAETVLGSLESDGMSGTTENTKASTSSSGTMRTSPSPAAAIGETETGCMERRSIEMRTDPQDDGAATRPVTDANTENELPQPVGTTPCMTAAAATDHSISVGDEQISPDTDIRSDNADALSSVPSSPTLEASAAHVAADSMALSPSTDTHQIGMTQPDLMDDPETPTGNPGADLPSPPCSTKVNVNANERLPSTRTRRQPERFGKRAENLDFIDGSDTDGPSIGGSDQIFRDEHSESDSDSLRSNRKRKVAETDTPDQGPAPAKKKRSAPARAKPTGAVTQSPAKGTAKKATPQKRSTKPTTTGLRTPPNSQRSRPAKRTARSDSLNSPMLMVKFRVPREALRAIVFSEVDPIKLKRSLELIAREPLESKPTPQGQPEVWADSRQALCETLPYFKKPQGGCYSNDGHVYGFLFDSVGHCREYMDEDVIICRAGGSMESDPNGGMVQRKDQNLKEAQALAVLNDIVYHNPVIVICGNRNVAAICKMPHQYNVLGWYKPVMVWSEKTAGKGSKVWTTVKYRLERLNHRTPAWHASSTSAVPVSTLPSAIPADTEPADTEPADTEPADTEPSNAMPQDTPPVVTPPSDTPPSDAIRSNVMNQDTVPSAAPSPDAPPSDGIDTVRPKASVRKCQSCGEESAQVYLGGWMCLHQSCCQFWKFSNGVDAPVGKESPDDNRLRYNPDFLDQRSDLWKNSTDANEPEPAPLRPRVRDVGQVIGDNLAYVNTRGICCPKCGRCNSRRLFEKWVCESPTCDYELRPQHRVVVPTMLHTPWDAAPTLVRNRHSPSVHVKVEHKFGYKISTYTFKDDQGVGIEGCFIHAAISKEVLDGEVHGPDNMFRAIQEEESMGLERRTFAGQKGSGVGKESLQQVSQIPTPPLTPPSLTDMPQCSSQQLSQALDEEDDTPKKQEFEDGDLMTAFSMNYGMPYKFVANGASRDFKDSPWPVTECRRRLNWAQEALLGEKGDDFNEELIFAYLEGQKIEYHDDGEQGLGPRIATMSLGGRAKMHMRMKMKHFVGCTKTGLFTEEKPVPGSINGEEMYEKRLAYWNELQALKAKGDTTAYNRRRKEIPKELGIYEKRNKKAEDLVTVTLCHGDIIVMDGYDIQKYLEHKVVPEGYLRFALTCRTVLPDHLKEHERPDYTVDVDPEKYNPTI